MSSYTGVLELTAEKKQNKTILSSCYYEGALKITRPVYLEEEFATVYLIHVGGGYVGGDSYSTHINVGNEAQLGVTTQSSTKVYRTPSSPVMQKTAIKIGSGGVLEYIPDPLIAYADARFIQETTVEMEEDSCLFYSDIITPGWAPDGSLFQYDYIRSKLKVCKAGNLVLFDHLLLEPDKKISGIMQMEGFTHVGTFILFHQKVDKPFVDDLFHALDGKYFDVKFGVSNLPNKGAVLRILANNSGVIDKMISHAHTYARSVLLGKESVRWRKY